MSTDQETLFMNPRSIRTFGMCRPSRIILMTFVVGFLVCSIKWLRKTQGGREFQMNTMRSLLTFYNNSDFGHALPTNISAAEAIFHRYASTIQVHCPISKRFGRKKDGGWDVCLFASYAIKKPCLIYSFGINNDWSFDDHISKTFNCTVRSFDPSMKVSDHRRGNNIWFYRLGIGGSDATNTLGWQLKTMTSFLQMFNEGQEIIDYLKIDVEYSEWTSLDHILSTSILSRVKQLGLEIHTKEKGRKKKGTSTIQDLTFYYDILRRLQDAGFYIWYWHFNHFGTFVSKYSREKLSCCYEMVLINVNLPVPVKNL